MNNSSGSQHRVAMSWSEKACHIQKRKVFGFVLIMFWSLRTFRMVLALFPSKSLRTVCWKSECEGMPTAKRRHCLSCLSWGIDGIDLYDFCLEVEAENQAIIDVAYLAPRLAQCLGQLCSFTCFEFFFFFFFLNIDLLLPWIFDEFQVRCCL